MPPLPTRLLVVGNDVRLIHLLRRYGEQSGCQLIVPVPASEAMRAGPQQPTALVFLSLDDLQTAQTVVDDLAALETPVLVCASVAEEARARELGADACLLHPLTYEHFLAVLVAIGPSQAH